MNASSIEELLASNLLYKNGHVATASDLGAAPNPSTGKLMVSGGMEFAVPDGCHPRQTSVEIFEPGLPPNSILYPRCVKVLRCGGCCGTPNVECVPWYVERAVYNLLELSMGSPAGYQVVRPYPLQIERHVSCKCECTLSQEVCGPNKEFSSAACSCLCRENVRCFPPKMFNPETCGCECATREVCCPPNYRDCRFEFNEETCECDVRSLRQHSSSNDAAGNITDYERAQQALMEGLNGNSNNNSINNNNGAQQQARISAPAVPTPAPETPPTTTAAAPPEPNFPDQTGNCASLICPAGFEVVNCSCSRSSRPSRPRPRPQRRSRSRRSLN